MLISGCSIFGDNGVESAPYTVLKSDEAQDIELRVYDSMVLVSADLSDDGRNSAFRKLFKYISGENEGQQEIAMTAPVFMDDNAATDQGIEIAMTAPVFMSENSTTPQMSFVMPSSFTIDTTPKPTDSSLSLTELNNYKVAVIKFSWTLSDSNTKKHTRLLEEWIAKNNYSVKGPAVTAGYNGPLTLPMFRHNEILIEVE
ncbi:heme-binding protein [Glaciecola sp. MH2013]|nr:heme-binding protein [Glaciecola sp. MH2013]